MYRGVGVLISVIIPAYNEQSKIVETLMPYVAEGNVIPGYEIFVVCNGCTDNTYELVMQNFPSVGLLDISEGSKIKAVNAGFELCSGDYVLVQDADVVIDRSSLSEMLDIVSKNDFLLASAKAIYRLDGASLLVRKYYEFIQKTRAFKSGMVGTGCYLINGVAAGKVFPLPNVIADDGYVKSVIGNVFFNMAHVDVLVDVPKDICSLVKIKTRSRLGNFQLKSMGMKHDKTQKNGIFSLLHDFINGGSFLGGCVYFIVVFVSILRAKIQISSGNLGWERDESSRG